MPAPRKSAPRWIVSGLIVCLIAGGAAALWQAEWLVTRFPTSRRYLSMLGVAQRPVATEDAANDSAMPPVAAEEDQQSLENPFDPGAQQEPPPTERATAADSREPRGRSPAFLKNRASGDDAGSGVTPAGFEGELQELFAKPGAGAANEEAPPRVAVKAKGGASTAKTQAAKEGVAPIGAKPATAKTKGSLAPIALDEAGGKTTPLIDMDTIDGLIQLGDYATAQREVSKWYWRTPGQRDELRKTLDELAQSLYFSPQPYYREPHVVQTGDQLRTIAQRHKISWEYLAKLNRVDPKKVRAGQKLKVVEGPFSALIIVSNYELIVHLNGSFVKSYRVGVGKSGATPIGTFTVKNKLIDPTYYGPEGVIANNDPKNPLGERWIDIGDSFGIHGTIDAASIGKNESRGCIRLLNSDVEEVYDLLVVGSEVKIQR